MRFALLCLCISGWWASLSSPSLAISVKYLAHASRDGDIVVRAHSSVGFQITALHVLNQRDTDLELDVNGSYLRSQVEGEQRIGIGIVRGGSGSSRLRLKPGESRDLEVLSVCMDANKSSPSVGSVLTLAHTLAPAKTRRVFSIWKANPRLSHSRVQSLVWGRSRSGRPLIPNRKRFSVPRVMDDVLEILSVDGRVFLLKSSGELFHGRNLALMRAMDGVFGDLWTGRAGVFALRDRVRGRKDGRFAAELVRYDSEREEWTDCRVTSSRGRLLWALEREAIVLDEGTVVRVDKKGTTPLLESAEHSVVTTGGVVYWADREDMKVLCESNLPGRDVRRMRLPAEIYQLAVVGKTAFALDEEGRLFRVRKGELERFRDDVSRVTSTGGVLVVEEDAKSTRPGEKLTLSVVSSAARSFQAPLPVGKVRDYCYDAKSKDFYCLLADDRLLWYDRGRGSWTRMAVLSAKESAAR